MINLANKNTHTCTDQLYNLKLHKIVMPNLIFAIYFYVSLRQIYFFLYEKK